jgi:ferredoxin like protein
MKRETLEEKLYTLKFRADSTSHLVVKDMSVCVACGEKWGRPCLTFCPAQVYEWEEDKQELAVRYEGCVECGACRIGCPPHNIDWRYPHGGFGVTHRLG